MAGFEVNRTTFDVRSGEAILALRKSLGQVRNIATWLAQHPGSGATDPLVVDFEYNEDDAYLIRLVFEHWEGVRMSNDDMLNTSRKLTGLE